MRNSLALTVTMMTLLTGCSLKAQRIPYAAPVFGEADYRVLGKTNHEECGTYIFGVDFKHAATNQRGTRPAIGRTTAEERRALYHALEKMPEATHLLAHRTHTTANGLVAFRRPIFGTRCAAVEARGVRIQEKPLPRD